MTAISATCNANENPLLVTATDQSSPPLPVGTDPGSVGEWDAADQMVPVRLCWSDPQSLPDHLLPYDIRAVVRQWPDGTATDPEVHIGDLAFSGVDVRLIAQALIDAADVGDRMAAR